MVELQTKLVDCMKGRCYYKVKKLIGGDSVALFKCSECGGKVSDKSKACVHCGCPINLIVRNHEQIAYNAKSVSDKQGRIFRDETNLNEYEKIGFGRTVSSNGGKNNMKKDGIAKDKTTALILSVLAGWLGVDRFYLGYMGMGILKLLTGGCFGIMWIIDIINIAVGNLEPSDGSGYCDNTYAASITREDNPFSDPYKELEKIKKLKEQGILNEAEYKELKSKYISKL